MKRELKVVNELVDDLVSKPFSRSAVRADLERKLRTSGAPALLASELSESLINIVLERLDKALERWDLQGVPRPLTAGANPTVLFGLEHRNYSGGLSSDFFDVLNFLRAANEHQMLGISALYCGALGCDRIFVTDKGGGDSGVDVLARRLNTKAIGHVVLAIQCKAEANPVNRLKVITVSNRFRTGLAEKNWREYLKAVAVSDLRQSPGRIFVLLASKGLSTDAERVAVESGLLCSSPIQITYALSNVWTCDQIRDFCGSTPSGRDLARNLALELPEKGRKK